MGMTLREGIETTAKGWWDALDTDREIDWGDIADLCMSIYDEWLELRSVRERLMDEAAIYAGSVASPEPPPNFTPEQQHLWNLGCNAASLAAANRIRAARSVPEY